MNLFDLSGKTANKTGSSRGISRAIAEAMAFQGARSCVNGQMIAVDEGSTI